MAMPLYAGEIHHQKVKIEGRHQENFFIKEVELCIFQLSFGARSLVHF